MNPFDLPPRDVPADAQHEAVQHEAVQTAEEISSRRRAAALAYEPLGADAKQGPRVVAKGERLMADEIIARARAAGVPVHESRELVSLLMQVDLDAHIPPALYIAVAEVLAWAYRLEHGNVTASSTTLTDQE